jgi:hypothetical protein
MQTGKSDLHPIVLLEVPGGTYWRDWLQFLADDLADRDLISEEDLRLVKHTADIEEAVDEICRFYHNYHSQRYVDGTMVLRVLRVPPQDALDRLGSSFADILRTPSIRPVEPSAQEVADGDALDVRRLALDFNQSSFARLRLLIDELNRF